MTHTLLYHATSSVAWQKIAVEGLRRGSYLGTAEIAAYYAETVADEDKEPVILEIVLDDLDPATLRPDWPGLEEPLTYTLGKSEEVIQAEFLETSQDWQASLDLIGSIRVLTEIPPEKIRILDEIMDIQAEQDAPFP